MRRYTVFCPKWSRLGTVKADGIEEALALAKDYFPSYRFVTVEGRY